MTMTQEQRNKKAEQLRLAAQIVETGCEWEILSKADDVWKEGHFSTPITVLSLGYEIRIKEPVIPVPEGWRELRDDEKCGDFILGARYLSEGSKEWCSLTSGCYATINNRIIVPVAKQRVPLEPGDVPPGSVVRGAGEAKEPGHQGWCLITSCSLTGIRYWRHCDDSRFSKELTWREMMESGMEIKRFGHTEWMPCWKEAQS